MTVRANDLFYYGLTKSQNYSQSSPAAPVPDFEPFSFYAFVADQNPAADLITDAQVDFPGGPIPLQCGQVSFSIAAWSHSPFLPRFWNPAESRVMFEEKIAGVQCFRFERRAVCRDQPPMSNFAAK